MKCTLMYDIFQAPLFGSTASDFQIKRSITSGSRLAEPAAQNLHSGMVVIYIVISKISVILYMWMPIYTSLYRDIILTPYYIYSGVHNATGPGAVPPSRNTGFELRTSTSFMLGLKYDQSCVYTALHSRQPGVAKSDRILGGRYEAPVK